MNNCLMTGAMIKKFVDTDVCTKEIALQVRIIEVDAFFLKNKGTAPFSYNNVLFS